MGGSSRCVAKQLIGYATMATSACSFKVHYLLAFLKLIYIWTAHILPLSTSVPQPRMKVGDKSPYPKIAKILKRPFPMICLSNRAVFFSIP